MKNGNQYNFYKKLIWLYIFLVIFEGALRKWFLPSLSNVLLVIRDPIVFYLVLVGIKKKWISNLYGISMIIVGVITFFLTMLVGHQNLIIAIFGARILVIYFPFMFVIGKVFNREDVIKVGKFVLLVSILVTIVVSMQYFSPQNSWINKAVGGEEGTGFGGVGTGFYRPSGIFSFISGLQTFNSIICVFLFWFLFNNNNYIKKPVLVAASCSYIIILFVSMSRTTVFYTVITFLFVLTTMLVQRGQIKKLFLISFLTFILIALLFQFEFFNIAVSNLLLRFELASKSEGDVISGTLGERAFGAFYRGLFDPQNFSGKPIPFFGFGQGLGTNVGAKFVGGTKTFLLAEEEWSRITDESGFLFGWIIIFIRLFFSFSLLKKSLTKLIKEKDTLPFILVSSSFPLIIRLQWSVPTLLGLAILIGGLNMAALKKK